MIRRIPLVVLIASMMLAGCTPLGENIARRTIGSTGGDGSDVALQLRPEGRDALDPSTQMILQRYGTTIQECAVQYGFDWRLIVAVMKQESRFDDEAQSERGALGLMQVMPVTQREIAGRLQIDDTTHPASNIRMGVYYLRELYAMFDGVNEADRLRLTLASYNAGLGRVYDAQEVAAYLGDNPAQWQSVKATLPLLSKRYASLHRSVWAREQRPHSGWFGSAGQTVAYVDAVMGYYDAYLRQLN